MASRRRYPHARCLTALLLVAVASLPAAAATQNPDFFAAVTRGDAAAVSVMLKDGVDVNQRPTGGWTALLHAVIGGHLEVVKVLIAAKADPDICASGYGQCRGPLMVALANGNQEMAQVLLDGGANVNATTSYGATPLRFALWGEGPERAAMVKALLARGADVDAGQVPGYKVTPARTRSAEGTALGDIAARNNNTELVKLLLDAGAKVDARQPGWRTPLMLAAIAGNVTVVRLLLDAGADVNAKDGNERTALDLAQANGRQDVAEMLRNAVARR